MENTTETKFLEMYPHRLGNQNYLEEGQSKKKPYFL